MTSRFAGSAGSLRPGTWIAAPLEYDMCSTCVSSKNHIQYIYSITFYASEIADFIRMWIEIYIYIYIFGDIANLEAWSTGMA